MFFYGSDRALLTSVLTEVRDLRVQVSTLTKVVQDQGKAIMIDTKSLLAAVAEETTELKSWEALASTLTGVIKTQADALAAAIAANDPVAMAQVQADLDAAATTLSADNAEAAAAIVANTPNA